MANTPTTAADLRDLIQQLQDVIDSVKTAAGKLDKVPAGVEFRSHIQSVTNTYVPKLQSWADGIPEKLERQIKAQLRGRQNPAIVEAEIYRARREKAKAKKK